MDKKEIVTTITAVGLIGIATLIYNGPETHKLKWTAHTEGYLLGVTVMAAATSIFLTLALKD